MGRDEPPVEILAQMQSIWLLSQQSTLKVLAGVEASNGWGKAQVHYFVSYVSGLLVWVHIQMFVLATQYTTR